MRSFRIIMKNRTIKRCVLMLNVSARMKTKKKVCILAPEYLAKLVFKKTLIRSLNKITLLMYEYSYLSYPKLFMPF